MRDWQATILSQFANSPTICQLIENMNDYFDPRANFEQFYNLYWNVDTATGQGLDYWGNIVGVNRVLQIPEQSPPFGFEDNASPPDVVGFNQAPFNSYGGETQAYILPDSTFRTMVLAKALANIIETSSPAINQLLTNLFPGRGPAYVLDTGSMTMQLTFEFELTPVELAIVQNVVPHPAGVQVTVLIVSLVGIIGFLECGYAETFGHGTFYAGR